METAGAEARDKGSVPYIKESRKIFRFGRNQSDN